MPFMNHALTGREVIHYDEMGYKETREVCPDCYHHAQHSWDPKTGAQPLDCKNEFFVWVEKNGRQVMQTVGQCCCWSYCHGQKGGN